MTAHVADILYWTITIITALIVMIVVIGFFYSASRGDPFIQIVPMLLAGAVWMIGWACRYGLAGR